MSFLLDTNVVSGVRKRRPDEHVLTWLGSVSPSDLYVSVLLFGEVRVGIERLRRRDPERAASHEDWLTRLATAYGERVLPVTPAIADRWGRLSAGRSRPVIDTLMAATALVHGLTLVTRNGADVDGTGVEVLDPFAG